MALQLRKIVFFASAFVFLYFALLIANGSIIHIDHVLFGVIQEMITIPSLAAILGLMFLSIKFFMEDKYKVNTFSFFSILILIACVSMIVWSLYYFN